MYVQCHRNEDTAYTEAVLYHSVGPDTTNCKPRSDDGSFEDNQVIQCAKGGKEKQGGGTTGRNEQYKNSGHDIVCILVIVLMGEWTHSILKFY